MVLPCSPSSLPPHLPMGILSSSGSLHRRNLSLEVFPPLPSPIFQEPGNDTTTRQNTTFPKSPVHPHFPSCFPKRFKLDPVPLHVMGMVDKVGELFLSAGRRGRGRKEGLPSRTSFSGRSHGGQGGVEERSIKYKYFQEGGGNFLIFFPRVSEACFQVGSFGNVTLTIHFTLKGARPFPDPPSMSASSSPVGCPREAAHPDSIWPPQACAVLFNTQPFSLHVAHNLCSQPRDNN